MNISAKNNADLEQRYMPHKFKATDNKSVWYYFLIGKSGDESAMCKRCKSILLTKGGSTKGLLTHLKKHNIDLKVLKKSNETQARKSIELSPPKKVARIEHFFEPEKDKSMEAVISRMAAIEGFSLSAFVNSEDLRESLAARGFQVPKSRTTITKIVLSHYGKVREKITAEIKKCKSEGEKFSLVFDEWTSSSNKHFLNINVYGQEKFWNIGLIRYKESMTASVCVELLKNSLSDINLCLSNDIVAITTDGASTMVKVGKLILPGQQLCLAHGIQLAVIDVLYKQTTSSRSQYQISTQAQHENDSSASDSDEEDAEDLDSLTLCNNEMHSELTGNHDIFCVVQKVRKTVRIFRKSPTKNDILQNYVKSDLNKELKLILDCRTRWSSLLDMLQRFILLEQPIKKAMVDLKIKNFLDSEYDIVRDVVEVLQPVKSTVEALCQQDMNLQKADIAIKCMLQEIETSSSILGNELSNSLKARIEQRRTIFSEVLNFLTDPNIESADTLFNKFTISELTLEIEKITKRFDEKENIVTEEDDDDDNVPIAQVLKASEKISFKTKLQQALTATSSNRQQNMQKKLSLRETIKREIQLFRDGGSRGKILEGAMNFLKTIQATSVESERCFSSSGYLCNKMRTRLNDETLNALISLRYFYNQKKKENK